MSSRPRSAIVETWAAAATWCLAALVFFRRPLTTGLDRLGGDVGDMRLIAVLHEHWLRVLLGDAAWRSPTFFAPRDGVLGYSDTFVLNSVLYVPLRAIGFDRLAAVQWTYILLSCIGFMATFRLLRGRLTLPTWVALVLSTVFCFANNLAQKPNHPQLYSVYWLPVVILAVMAAWSATSLRRRLVFGLGSGVMIGLVLYSGFYVGWFAALAAMLTAAAMASFSVRRGALPIARRWLRSKATVLAAQALGFVMVLVPFLLTFLPVLREFGERDYEEVGRYAPLPGDVVNVGGQNLLWGAAMRRLFGADSHRLVNNEVSLAITPMVWMTLVAAVLAVVGWRRRDRSVRTGAGDLGLCLSCVVVVLTWLPVQFGSTGLWIIPRAVIPGASGLRAIGRMQIVNSLVVCLAIGALLSEVLPAWTSRVSSERHRRRWTGALAAVGLLLVIEQVNLVETSGIDRSDELRWMAQVPNPPAECRAFFIVDSGPQVPIFQSNIDAMIISQDHDLPTLNGYSGQIPRGWWLDPADAAYLDSVRSWVDLTRFPVDGLCSFDRSTKQWATQPLGVSN